MKRLVIILYFIPVILLMGFLSIYKNPSSTVPQAKSASVSANMMDVVSITEEDVNIRNEANMEGEVLLRVSKGSEYPLTKISGDWYEIQITKNKKGYVSTTVSTIKKVAIKDKQTKSGPLSNKVIVLDPGHGGNDGGTLGKNGTIEKELTLKTATLLQKALEDLGAMVYMTRTEDVYVELRDRVQMANVYDSDIFISLHYDSSEMQDIHGLTTFYYNKEKDFNLGEIIHGNLVDTTNLKNRDVVHGNLQVLRDNERPSILIELGFLSNADEERRLNQTQTQKEMVEGIKNGVLEYFNILDGEM